MNVIDKFRNTHKCPVDYIEKLPNYSVDVTTLLAEANVLKPLDWNNSSIQDVFIQRKFSLMYRFKWNEIISSMPYTMSVLDSLKKEMPYNSVYYRYLNPYTCYNWHTDRMHTCIHIPLITNEGCKFVYTDKVFTMPADGSVYMVNNSIPHTFVNAGSNPRLHITLDIF
jgi:hypothetical protein